MPAHQWIANWAQCRGGNVDNHIIKAWKQLYEKIYTSAALCGQAVLMNARPQLEGVEGWNTLPGYDYKNIDLWEIWKELLKAEGVYHSEYHFDVINVGRQVLGNLFADYRDKFTDCYRKKDLEGTKVWGQRMDQLLLDVDRLLCCSPVFSIGKWIKDAKDFAVNEQEQKYYEENARCILTVWGQKDTQLNDYANRGWGGLTRTFYRERWKRFTEEVIAAMTRHKNFDEEKFHQDITQFEYEWTLKNEDFPITSEENPISLAKELILKYDDDFRSLYP